MRTTLTLDPDVAAALARRRAQRGTGLKQEVNELLRSGLAAADRPAEPADDDFEPPVWKAGRRLLDWPEMQRLLQDDELERYRRSQRDPG